MPSVNETTFNAMSICLGMLKVYVQDLYRGQKHENGLHDMDIARIEEAIDDLETSFKLGGIIK